MSTSLYDALVPSWLQILGALSGLIDKAEAHCRSRDVDPSILLNARLALDMRPLAYQVKASTLHSIGAINSARDGRFILSPSKDPNSFDDCRRGIGATIADLSALNSTEVDALRGRDLVFDVGSYQARYLAEEFLLSFSVPNFYFHATTAYGILRAQGVAIGKIDYLGKLRQKA